MGSYYRDGGDYMTCIECGSRFDLNDPERRAIHEGGVFQPFCKRHLRQKLAEKYGGRSEIACVVCGTIRETDEMGLVNHMHPTGEVDPVFVCSQECTLNQLRSNAAWLWHGDDVEFSETTAEDSRRARAVADRAVKHLSENYRCEAVLLPELVDMKTFEFTVSIERPYRDVDEAYVERFDRIGFDTEYGPCTLKLIDYAAFGVCKFDYDLTNSAQLRSESYSRGEDAKHWKRQQTKQDQLR